MKGTFKQALGHWFSIVAAGLLAVVCNPSLAGNYYIDPNYAGVEGAPFGSYVAAYKSITTALGSTGMPAGASASNPNRLVFAPGVYNTAITTGVSLSNSRNNIALVGLTGNPG